MSTNPTGLKGIEFVEFSSQDTTKLHNLFIDFGFSKLMSAKNGSADFYKQHDINFIVNKNTKGHSFEFSKVHGPCISAMAFRAENASMAYETALTRGAKSAKGEYFLDGKEVPAIYGIGDSLIYFVDQYTQKDFYETLGFNKLENGFPVFDEKSKKHIVIKNFFQELRRSLAGIRISVIRRSPRFGWSAQRRSGHCPTSRPRSGLRGCGGRPLFHHGYGGRRSRAPCDVRRRPKDGRTGSGR